MKGKTPQIILFFIIVVLIVFLFMRQDDFELPKGETVSVGDAQVSELGTDAEDEVLESEVDSESNSEGDQDTISNEASKEVINSRTSKREVFVTDGTFHSIPLNEILSGGPPKDGIPSIDAPIFINTKEADGFLDSDSIGLGLFLNGEARFYPYQILVWHEIVNDKVANTPVLVTYCPLCATGIVFDRRVNGEEQEFGVSGKLWKSNLLMYNRTGDVDTESLWSQVLGEAVLGPETGDKLKILRSDTVKYSDWKQKYPQTKVLSRETGEFRNYGTDPYGNYYTNTDVSFGASFNDNRLHPKVFVLGIEINGSFKAYPADQLPVGTTQDTLAGISITIEKNTTGEIDIFAGTEKTPIETVDGFWFSWLAVHPDTLLYDN